MSEPLHHECGLAVVRLRKPLEYYAEKYGTPLWGFYRLFLLMEKQHNRGQDGAGVGAVRLDMPPGKPYLARARSIKPNSLDRIFKSLIKTYDSKVKEGKIHPEFVHTVKENFDFGAELLLGHLRYGTSGGYSQKRCHPYFRKSNWPMRNLLLAGNFNMTNTAMLNQHLIDRGQHPIFDTDTQTILEEVGYHLDEEHTRLYRHFRDDMGLQGLDNSTKISEALDPARILRIASENWDGGYSIAGLIGNGDSFVVRDPWGIRPLYAMIDDEVIAYASERAPLMTVFHKEAEEVRQVEPGTIEVVKAGGTHSIERIREPQEQTSCAFERIYFSRGNDPDIYQERKLLGAKLVPQVLEAIEGDLQNTVFSYIPNTSEVAYYGLMQGLRQHRREEVKADILKRMKEGTLDEECLDELIMSNWPRSEKVANKDIKLRTFISQEKNRGEMVSHVYDITYGSVEEKDNLVCLDDSIVRGTTLKKSVIQILSRLKPSRIFILSTAPQIRYPDCYGIDMSEIGNFIAFQAAVALLKEEGRSEVLREVYQDCLEQEKHPERPMKNHVARIYESYTEDRISQKISELVRPKTPWWDGELRILFLEIEKMHEALPNDRGDWYFTGNFPSPGGYKALNRAYINFYEKKNSRSY